MPVVYRATMSDLIAHVRLLINDPSGASQQFSDTDIQLRLDASRNDVRYETLHAAPSIVNISNQAQTIFADFYSSYGWWEADIVLQAYSGGNAWVVVTPVAQELLIEQAHFQFETNVFASGTAPGQLPPVFATGKTFDVYRAAADLLEFWSARWLTNYDFSSDGASFHRSQVFANMQKLVTQYRKRQKPKTVVMTRSDLADETTLTRTPLVPSAVDSLVMEQGG